MNQPIRVCVSGYFDPLHIGHLEYLQYAKQLGTVLVVIVNNDHQAILKKGRPFMRDEERVEIVRSLRMVDFVYLSIDQDRTVCESLREVVRLYGTIHIFANGGDQQNTMIPEGEVCKELSIQLMDGLGLKVQSSSWLTGLKPVISNKEDTNTVVETKEEEDSS